MVCPPHSSPKKESTPSPIDWSEFHLWCYSGKEWKREVEKRDWLALQQHRLLEALPITLPVCTCLKTQRGVINAFRLQDYSISLIRHMPHQSCQCPSQHCSHPSAIRNASTQLAAGALGGATATYATHWLDTLKTKMQTFPMAYSSSYHCMKKTLHYEGIAGLYQGATPALVAHTCKAAIVFTAYGICEEMVKVLLGKADVKDLTIWHHASAGAMTGIGASFVLCPLELIKCRMQALHACPVQTGHPDNKFPLRMARNIIRAEGVRGLYRGLTGMWVKEIPGSFVYFGSYEAAKSILRNLEHTESLSAPELFTCGLFAGLCFCVTHPLESVKTRVQVMSAYTQTTGFLRAFCDIVKTEGLTPLCSGIKPQMLRACLFSGIQFLAYETAREHILHRNNEESLGKDYHLYHKEDLLPSAFEDNIKAS